MTWKPLEPATVAVAVYNFDARNGAEISFSVGDTLVLCEECDGLGWYRGYVKGRKSGKKGIFPASYVCLKTPEDLVTWQVVDVLREWGKMWKSLYVNRDEHLVRVIHSNMQQLILLRRDIMMSQLPEEQLAPLKLKIANKIDWANERLGLDFIPREASGDPVDVDACSVLELYKIHGRSLNVEPALSKCQLAQGASTHHLYVHVTGFICQQLQSEEAEMLLSIYDPTREHFESERFCMRLSKAGTPESGASNSCLFTDLDSSDLTAMQDFYVVIQVLRVGKMDQNSKKSSPSANYRRPFACAVVPIRDLIISSLNDEENLCHMSAQLCTSDDKDFWQLHEMIIRRLVKANERHGNVNLTMRLFHGDLTSVQKSNVNYISKSTPVVRKLRFADIMIPGESRNDIFITLDSGEFEKGGKSTPKNIEVTMRVLTTKGEVLKVIHPAAGHEVVSEYHSFVVYHNNSPHWGETVRLSIPLERVMEAYILFTIKHCSRNDDKKYNMFATMKIIHEDGTTVSDACHELSLYRCSSKTSSTLVFVQMPSTVEEAAQSRNHGLQELWSPRESLSVTTRVCSTTLTQDYNLLGLLQWRAKQPYELVTILDDILLVSGKDICLFLQDTFDALFGILDGDNELCNHLVVRNIVHIIALLSEDKYWNFRTTLNTYIAKHFSAAMVYRKLIFFLRGYLDNADQCDLQGLLIQLVSGLDFLLKIVIRSRALFAVSKREMGLQSFKVSLTKVLKGVMRMITKSEVSLETKEIILKNFNLWLSQLCGVFRPDELVDFIVELVVTAVPADIPKHPLLEAKLKLMLEIVASSIFSDSDVRRTLLPRLLAGNLIVYIQRPEKLVLAWEVVSSILSRLENVATANDKQTLVHLLVPPLVSAIAPSAAGQDKTTVPWLHTAVCSFLAVLHMMDAQSFDELHTVLRSPAHVRRFLKELFTIIADIIENIWFNGSWNALRLKQAYIILKMMGDLTGTFIQPFLDQLDTDVLCTIFEVGSLFIAQSAIQLEAFSWVKQERIEQRYGDMRASMATKLAALWERLGEHKSAFIPRLVAPLVKASLVGQEDVQQAVLPIFVEMFEIEYVSYGSFTRVDQELCVQWDAMITSRLGDYRYLTTVETIWQDRLHQSAVISDEGKEEAGVLVKRLMMLAKLLIGYRGLGQEGDRGGDCTRRLATLYDLILFYKENDQPEMYKRSIYALADMYISAQNWSEAAFTLLVIAKELQFDSEELEPPCLTYPLQTAGQRKEALLWDILSLFDKSQLWEDGINVCDELADWYRHHVLNYKLLSKVYSTTAQFYRNIVTEVRPAREYFRVGFYGQGFPMYLRNRVFVYRGEEYEKLGTFSERIQAEHPGAALMTTNILPGDEIRLSECRYLQICTVKPIPDSTSAFNRTDVLEYIREFWRVNHVSCFGYSRPFHKGPKDKENEFKSLWLERITLTTVQPLPSILPWMEVRQTEVEEISPIQNAVDTMVAKNNELTCMIATYRSESARNINPLSMALNGVIDAAVMGGTDNYEKAFFVPGYAKENPQDVPTIQKLRELIKEQVVILESGLEVHRALAPSSLMPFHQKMEGCFLQMKEKVFGPQACKESPIPSTSSPACLSSPVISTSPDVEVLHQHRCSSRRLTALSGSTISSFSVGSPNSESGSNSSQSLTKSQSVKTGSISLKGAAKGIAWSVRLKKDSQ